MPGILHAVRLRFDAKYALAKALEHYEAVRAQYDAAFPSEAAADRWMRDMSDASETVAAVYRTWPHL